jgi:hypothetical protein
MSSEDRQISIRERDAVVKSYATDEHMSNSSNVGVLLLVLFIVVAVAVTAILLAQSNQNGTGRLMEQMEQMEQNRLLQQFSQPQTPAPQVIQSPPQVIQVPVPREVKVPQPNG